MSDEQATTIEKNDGLHECIECRFDKIKSRLDKLETAVSSLSAVTTLNVLCDISR